MDLKLENKLKLIEEETPIANDEELIEALNRIIDEEQQKREKDMDIDLIKSAVDYIILIQDGNLEETEKESERAKNEFLEMVHNETFAKTKPSMRSPLRYILVAAVIIVAMAAGIFATFKTLDIDMMDIRTFLGLEKDTEHTEGDHSLTITDNFGEYLSIDDLMEKEGLKNILVPDETITDVKVVDCENYKKVVIAFDISNIEYTIESPTQTSHDNLPLSRIGDYDVVVLEASDYIQGSWIYKDNYYVVKTSSIEQLTEIINNITEYEK
ncbi:MAG: hypothetical protein IJZ89_05265 [Clostridia bacterium]|nr:hypothetical protein [Clostridia bacterium]